MAGRASVTGSRTGVLVCLLSAAGTGLGGCNAVGPAALASGRGVYNEVIRTTEDEQTLDMIVRLRYRETFGMLAVASVTANVSVRANAGAQARAWGDAQDVAGNLVPLSVGVAYEENPTISYVPLTGEKHIGRLLARMTLEEILLIAGATDDLALWMREAIASVEGVVNSQAFGGADSPDFDRFIDAYASLHRAHVLGFGRMNAAKESEPQYLISIHHYEQHHGDDVRALLDTLGIEGVVVDGGEIFLPVRWSFGTRTADAIDIETRSPLDVIRSAGRKIEVPAPHLEAGIVEPLVREAQEHDRFITIRSSEKRPENAVVAVPFRDWWFFIDATDARSKNAFLLIRTLLTVYAEDKSAQQTPIITIPTK